MTDYHLVKDRGGEERRDGRRKGKKEKKEKKRRIGSRRCKSFPQAARVRLSAGRKSRESLLAEVACSPFFPEQLSGFLLLPFRRPAS